MSGDGGRLSAFVAKTFHQTSYSNPYSNITPTVTPTVTVTDDGRLSAFVAKTFHQAKPYVFIDDEVTARAIDWMVARQSPDGSFPEPGRVIHKNMQARQWRQSA